MLRGLVLLPLLAIAVDCSAASTPTQPSDKSAEMSHDGVLFAALERGDPDDEAVKGRKPFRACFDVTFHLN